MAAARPPAFTTSSHSLDHSVSSRAARASAHEWRSDVIDGVTLSTLSVAIAAVPSFVLAMIWRAARGEWEFVILIAVLTAGILVTRSRRLGMAARAAVLVGLFLSANGVTMMYARSIPFNGSSVPMGAAIATLVGGVRWGGWTLAALSAT
jgi:hypothetical protein